MSAGVAASHITAHSRGRFSQIKRLVLGKSEGVGSGSNPDEPRLNPGDIDMRYYISMDMRWASGHSGVKSMVSCSAGISLRH